MLDGMPDKSGVAQITLDKLQAKKEELARSRAKVARLTPPPNEEEAMSAPYPASPLARGASTAPSAPAAEAGASPWDNVTIMQPPPRHSPATSIDLGTNHTDMKWS